MNEPQGDIRDPISDERNGQEPVLVSDGIEERARERFGVLDLTIRHSLGRVAAGEISLLIIVHGRHRAEALNGLQYVIEEVKHTVPIWKKEILSDGSFVWVE